MEDERITPELAYVKALEYISLSKLKAQEACHRIRHSIKEGILYAAAAGALLILFTHNPASLFIPLVILLVKTAPMAAKACGILQNGIRKMDSDREKLETGKADPRDYYEKIRYHLTQRGKTDLIEYLTSDTSGLSSREREMLAGFSGEETRKMPNGLTDSVRG